jgi:large subunit ribosomal protein LP1
MALSNDELACVYAALILADDNVDVKGDKIAAILKAANYEIEPYWPGLFAGALEGIKVTDLIKNIGSAPAAGAAAPATTAPAASADKKPAGKEAAKKEEKKEEKEDSEGEDMVWDLFNSIFIYFHFSFRASAYSIKIQSINNTHNRTIVHHFSFLDYQCLCVYRFRFEINKKKIK